MMDDAAHGAPTRWTSMLRPATGSLLYRLSVAPVSWQCAGSGFGTVSKAIQARRRVPGEAVLDPDRTLSSRLFWWLEEEASSSVHESPLIGGRSTGSVQNVGA